MAEAKAAAEHLARQAAAAQQELCALKLQQESGRLGQLALSRDGPLGQLYLCMLTRGAAAISPILCRQLTGTIGRCPSLFQLLTMDKDFKTVGPFRLSCAQYD